MTGNEKGLALVELIVAIVILAVGMMMLAGGSLFVTRDLTRSRLATRAASIAQARLDLLRTFAASTSPACSASGFASSSSPTVASGVTLTWVVPVSGASREVRVITSISIGRGRTVVDTLVGNVAC